MKIEKNINTISKISLDIDLIGFEQIDTLEQIIEKFYNIMRKHGIKKYTLTSEENLVENSEWLMCYSYFLNKLINRFEMLDYFATLPEDLKHY